MYEIESFHQVVVTNATCQGHHIKKKEGEYRKHKI